MKRLLVIFAVLLIAGCKTPNKANIQLRKEKAELESRLKEAAAQRQADRATIVALQSEKGSLPTLPAERLDELFTVTGLDINKLTGFRKEGLKVYATPVDKAGDPLKAAGTLVVQAYDLSKGDKASLGRWEFPLKDAGANWYQSWVVSGYALTCPLEAPAKETDITVHVSFTDALTGRTIEAQRVVKSTLSTSSTR